LSLPGGLYFNFKSDFYLDVPIEMCYSGLSL